MSDGKSDEMRNAHNPQIRDIVPVRYFNKLERLLPKYFTEFDRIDEAIKALGEESVRMIDLANKFQEIKVLNGLPKANEPDLKDGP